MLEDETFASDLPNDDETRPETTSAPQTAGGKRPKSPRTPKSPKTPRSPKSRPHSADKKPKCRSRIDQLAIPTRRLILALYQEHAYHLPRDKVEKIKILLQELYAMSPEETEKYFEHLRKKASEAAKKRGIKYMLKKLIKNKNKVRAKRRAYEFLYKLLIKGMEYAVHHPIPPLVSIRLRNLSNIVLEQICDLRNVDIPSREQPCPADSVLIQVADWMAVAIEHLYYKVQLKKNEEMEKIEKEALERENTEKDKEKDKKDGDKTDADKTDTEKTDADKTDAEKTENETEPAAVLSEELNLTDME